MRKKEFSLEEHKEGDEEWQDTYAGSDEERTEPVLPLEDEEISNEESAQQYQERFRDRNESFRLYADRVSLRTGSPIYWFADMVVKER